MKAVESSEIKMNLVQGEFRVSGDPRVVMTSLLGSCVAACICDPLAGVGGMNHFLLPGTEEHRGSGVSERYGAYLMELLVNGLLKLGAGRDRLQAKIFGGARTVRGLGDIGGANGAFARDFLLREGITLLGVSLGGETGRRIQFWPATGRARQLFTAKGEDVPFSNPRLTPSMPHGGELELF